MATICYDATQGMTLRSPDDAAYFYQRGHTITCVNDEQERGTPSTFHPPQVTTGEMSVGERAGCVFSGLFVSAVGADISLFAETELAYMATADVFGTLFSGVGSATIAMGALLVGGGTAVLTLAIGGDHIYDNGTDLFRQPFLRLGDWQPFGGWTLW